MKNTIQDVDPDGKLTKFSNMEKNVDLAFDCGNTGVILLISTDSKF